MTFIETKPGSSWKGASEILQMGFGFSEVLAPSASQVPPSLGGSPRVAKRPKRVLTSSAAPTADAATAPAIASTAAQAVAPTIDLPQPRKRGRKKAVDTLVLDEPQDAETVTEDAAEIERYYVVSHHNLKHPKIFPPPPTPSNEKILQVPRKVVIEQPSATRNGLMVTLLGNSVTACYTTNTLNVIAVLNEMWQEQGAQNDGRVVGSYAEFVRRLKFDPANESRGRKMVKAELARLRRLMMKFEEVDQSKGLRFCKEISYLSHYDYVEDKNQAHKNHWVVKIDSYIIEGVKEGLIASLPIKSLLAAKEDESKAILLRVDSLLVYNQRIAMSLSVISDLLCISPDDYRLSRKIYTRRMLDKIAKDLDGMVLSNGCAMKVSLEEAERGFRLVFERGECVASAQDGGGQMLLEVNQDVAVVERLKLEMLDVVGERNPVAVEGLYRAYARFYPEELIQRAIAVFRADKPRTEVLASSGAFFSSILCRIVKEAGYRWVR